MDHRELLKSLSHEQRSKITAKSDFQGLSHLALHWGFILSIGTLIAFRVPGWPFLIVVQGVLIIFLFCLLHETCHDTVFKSVQLNRMVGHVCGFMIFLPAKWFRYFHLAHHRHTHDPENDPELQSPKPENLTGYIKYVSGLPVWLAHLRTFTRNGRGKCADKFVPQKRLISIRNEARYMLAGYLLIGVFCFVFEITQVIYVWLIPIIIGQPFLRLYLLAEHGRCPHVANMFENTRTTFTTYLVRKLAWNMPYHVEHHTHPTVPFYLLPQMHKLIRDHLLVTENGYIRFNRRYIGDLKK